MQNVKVDIKGTMLVLSVDMSKRFGKSASGKTTIIATTQGNQSVPGHDGASFGLNVYTKAE